MDAAVQTTIPLREELGSVREFLRNETFRYRDRLYWDCTVDPDVDQGIRIPKKLVLTFVEKTMNHRLFQDQEKGKVEVSVHRSTLGMLIMVTDNGRSGTAAEPTAPLNGPLKLLDEYLKVYNRQSKERISYKILDRCAGESNRHGSRVLITIKFSDSVSTPG